VHSIAREGDGGALARDARQAAGAATYGHLLVP
jgi:hypothetical protein